MFDDTQDHTCLNVILISNLQLIGHYHRYKKLKISHGAFSGIVAFLNVVIPVRSCSSIRYR